MTCGVVSIGLDAVEVPRIAAMIARWGDRFLARVFTPAERAYCDARRARAVHYAARFAVKEAASKALGTGISLGVRWRDVETARAPGGPPEIRLHGGAAARARALGAGHALVTITHTGTVALAAVVLVTAPPVENTRGRKREGRRDGAGRAGTAGSADRRPVEISSQPVGSFSASRRRPACPPPRRPGYSHRLRRSGGGCGRTVESKEGSAAVRGGGGMGPAPLRRRG